MIDVKNLHKAYGDHEVLKGVNEHIEKGEKVVVIGPSGSGKSTFLRCINHLETMDSGSITVDGVQIGYVRKGGELTEASYAETARQRHRIGMVFQSFNLFPHMTVLENVMEVPVRVHKEDPETVRDRALKLLAKVGLADKADEYPRRLSGGQQQRVSIARALCISPDLLLFDEPTSALDPELVGDVLATIRDLADGGYTMIIVTHEIPFSRDVADWVVFMDNGIVVEEGKPEDILVQPKQKRTQDFLKRYLAQTQEKAS